MLRIVFKISVSIVFALACGSFISAADLKGNSNPCKFSEMDAAGLNGDLSVDIHALSAFMDTVTGILREENFEELDCLADQVRSSKEKFAGGVWKLHTMYSGLRRPVPQRVHPTQADWTSHMQRLQRWVKARPESITARVALASAYVDYAYDARGNGYADTVSETGWKLYAERTAKAERILKDASTLAAKCPEWYVAMQAVSQSEGWPVTEARALFEEAYQFEPEYSFYNARTLANYLLPKWSGEPGETELFVQQVADRIGGEKGDILYFQVAEYVLCGCQNNPNLSWDRIKRGFEASEKQNGTSMLNLNRIAYLATYYGKHDPIYAEKILKRIGDQWDDDTWANEEAFKKVKRWAADIAPAAEQERTLEVSAEANEHTPEGARYKIAFEKAFREMLQQCVKTDGGSVAQWGGEFETLVDLSAKGEVENLQIQSNGPVVMCVYKTLGKLRQAGTTPFPPPPQPSYWLKLSMDWAEFAPEEIK